MRRKKKTPKIKSDRDTYFAALMRKNRIHSIKIGLCNRNQAARRIRQLQTGCPDKLKLLAVARGNLERKWHRKFAGYRMKIGEYFKPAVPLLRLIERLRVIQRLVERFESLDPKP